MTRQRGRIIAMVGCSGSGKSTLAREIQTEIPNSIIVSRDDIRKMLFGYNDLTIHQYYEPRDEVYSKEHVVSRYEQTLIYDSLEQGKVVIVDNTHVRLADLKRLSYYNVDVELKIVDTDLDTILRRNESRNGVQDMDTIIKQHEVFKSNMASNNYTSVDFTPKKIFNNSVYRPCVVFDIDGTLAHKGDRSPYDMTKVDQDTVDLPTAYMLDVLRRDDIKIIICTGRTDDGHGRELSEKWLQDHGMYYDEFYIRANGDQRADWVVKEEFWEKICENNHILGMYDDRLQVVRRARMLGFKVFNVEHNNF